jgi:hypothetical protein
MTELVAPLPTVPRPNAWCCETKQANKVFRTQEVICLYMSRSPATTASDRRQPKKRQSVIPKITEEDFV